jgi:hypothetical protein
MNSSTISTGELSGARHMLYEEFFLFADALTQEQWPQLAPTNPRI